MSVPAPTICEPSPDCCAVPSPPFYGQGRTYLSAQTGFVLDCPPGFECTSGAYPFNIIIPGGTIPFTPPVIPGGFPLRLTCCDGSIAIRFLLPNYTQSQFDTAAQALVDEAASKLAGCKAAAYNQQHSRKPRDFRFLTGSLESICAGEEVLYELRTTGGVSPLVFTLNGGTLPTGLSLSPDGFIGGTPTVPGYYSFSVTVTDDADATVTKAFAIGVAGITTVSLPNGTVDDPYSQALAQAGLDSPVTWSVIAGALPDGLTLDSASGVLAGIPTVDGDFSFTVQASDATLACSMPFSLTVDPNPVCGSTATEFVDIDWIVTPGQDANFSVTGATGTFGFTVNPGDPTSAYVAEFAFCNPDPASYNLTVTIPYNYNLGGVTSAYQIDIWANNVPFGTFEAGSYGPLVGNGTLIATIPMPQGPNGISIRVAAAQGLFGGGTAHLDGTITLSKP